MATRERGSTPCPPSMSPRATPSARTISPTVCSPRPAPRTAGSESVSATMSWTRAPRPPPSAPPTSPLLARPTLNPLLAAGRTTWSDIRRALTAWVTVPSHQDTVAPLLHPLSSVTLHLPFEVADYVDFYASENHARNVGQIFRPDAADSLTPNWKHLPIGYHGRSGTVVVSGTEVVRPSGQRKAPTDPAPLFGPSVRLDIEAEVGFVVGTPSSMGSPVALSAFPGPRLRPLPTERLVRPRHPGLGVRPAGPVPRQVLRHVRVGVDHAAGRAGGRPDRPACPHPPPASLPRRRRGGARRLRPAYLRRRERPHHLRAPLLHHVLDGRTAARPHDRQRCLPAHRRPLRLGHGQRPHRTRTRFPPRTHLERHRPPRPPHRQAHLPGGRRRGHPHRLGPGARTAPA